MGGKNFYNLSSWRAVRERKIAESGGVCAKCGRVHTDTSKLIVHHIKHLKGNDYNNPEVAYADSNLEVICVACHNEEHDRFKNVKTVCVVFGPPLAGKHTFVKENKGKDDLVIDIDNLFSAMTSNAMYDKPQSIFYNVQGVFQFLLDQVSTRYGYWRKAWIIGGYANAYDRDYLCKKVGASECILVDTSKEECLRRLNDSRNAEEWTKYINKWFEEYIPPKD